MPSKFKFKQFEVQQEKSSMKVNTDGILLGAWADVSDSNTILDIGTGNGLIALMLAQRNVSSQIVGVEIEEGAYEEAQFNASHSPFGSRITMVNQPIQSFAENTDLLFDHIVSNPPFFTGGTFSTNENKALVRHTVKLPHGDLIRSVGKCISKGGLFSLILPPMEGYRFIELAERTTLKLCKQCTMYSKADRTPERLLLTFVNGDCLEVEESQLTIYVKGTKDYTDEFKALTKDFYLHF